MPLKQLLVVFILFISMTTLLSCQNINDKITTVDFNKHVRPILNNKCITCHGGVKKSSNVSFLFRDEAITKGKSGLFTIIPGQPEKSELIRRIKSHDPEERMPMGKEPLSEREIDILEKWISQGAEWKDHWSFVKPELLTTPTIEDDTWSENTIDKFILARLSKESIEPSEEADKITLIRRLSLDLIGLPPNPEEVDAFLSDEAPNAYEKVIDRLLDSPHYGERWASMWLDLARYADSKGYEKDGHRNIWKYRDWVIDAFNNNLPFDQFTIDQLAGDLLPDPTTEQLVATAFHRNTMNNDEGGTDDEEYRIAAVMDRVNTTWEVWQGITFGCVQCHSHPYEPILQPEYYNFMAYLNNTADNDKPNEKPVMEVFTKEQEADIAQLTAWVEKQDKSPIVQAKSIAQIKGTIKASTLPIMEELEGESSRKTHVFIRGNWMDKGDEVQPAIPVNLVGLPDGANNNRLGMAQWLVSSENTLTSRVTVNRFWGQLFGKGLVETQEDFGSQGFAPSHPELLDWLAVTFQNELKWDMKALLKLIVSSATYKQSSKVSPEMWEKDQSNILLARGQRLRLSAEQVRDQTLAVSGLLSNKMFGPSVMPYQPDGIWQAVYSGSKWVLAEGEDEHRRALYTYWRRTSPYPSMVTFDSPSREICVSRRIPTNTPLQALVTLNDPVYIEAANSLASIMDKSGSDITDKISIGYQRALGRNPNEKEMKSLLNLYKEGLAYFKENPSIQEEDKKEKTASLSGPLAIIGNAILNLDEFVTRP